MSYLLSIVPYVGYKAQGESKLRLSLPRVSATTQQPQERFTNVA